jgi:enamine deaminase RidA (YjgF/YER057c/UK114 family)
MNIDEPVARQCRVAALMLETACEKALQGDQYGVMIDYTRNSAWVDSRVPYGWVWDVSACGEENVR